ncbi:MAG: ComF family protein [Caldilineaceae bacterium]|nr:ComF family protein [Caldilineaceae bacterium]
MRATPRCDACRHHADSALAMMRIAVIHATPVRESIHALKYRNRPELADILARYLVATVMRAPWRDLYLTTDGVVPVPLHEKRRQERGYNQSELLASAFCRQSQLPLRSEWLMRRRATQSQVGLSATERQQNVASAFVADHTVRGKRLILFDDVYTTGATIDACARALHTAGAAAVYGLALACPR